VEGGARPYFGEREGKREGEWCRYYSTVTYNMFKYQKARYVLNVSNFKSKTKKDGLEFKKRSEVVTNKRP
jgi:hypothetical protein